MISPMAESQALTLAILFGLFFLLFDALQFFIVQMGPVKFRRWSGEGDRRSTLAQSPHQVTIVLGSLVQLCLVASAVFTYVHLSARATYGSAITKALLLWALIVVVWKVLLAVLPESIEEVTVRTLLPISQLFVWLFWPIVFPLSRLHAHAEARREENDENDDVSDEEVQAYIDVGEEEGILEEGEGKLVQSIVDFGDRIARELMTPRIDMLAFDVSGSLEDLARLFAESKYSRIPVYEQSVDKIVGIVHVKDLFDAYLRDRATPVRSLTREAYFVSETKNVSDLLREFQLEHLQIAVVVDEYGGTAGLISIEDIVEEIVGEIADEHEEEEESVVEVDRGVYLLNGTVRIEKIEELFEVDAQGESYETVAGLIFTSIGRVPGVGERVAKDGLIFEVDHVDRKRIYRVKVFRDPDYEGADEERGRRGEA
jgi:putative hemolysin